MIIGDINTLLPIMGRTSRQKISKETEDLNNTTDKMNLKEIYRTFQPTAAEYTLILRYIQNILQDRTYIPVISHNKA